MEVLEDDVKKDLRTKSLRYISVYYVSRFRKLSERTPRTADPESIELIKARGQALWNSIYEPHAVKLYNKLGSYHPDFISTWLIFLLHLPHLPHMYPNLDPVLLPTLALLP